jgi:hypothetical protein
MVCCTDTGFILDGSRLQVSGLSFSLSVIRGFRIVRLFRLMKSNKYIKLILDTMSNLMPQIANVMALVAIMLYIYAALGIHLFSGVML